MQTKVPELRKHLNPKRKKGKRMFVFLIFLVWIGLFSRSSFAKIEAIEIVGNKYVHKQTIRQVLETQPGDSFFFLNLKELETKVKAIPAIETVSMGKIFPSRIKVQIKEFPQVAVIMSAEGKKAAVLANGQVMPMTSNQGADKVVLSGWQKDGLHFQEICHVLSKLPKEVLSDLSEIYPDPSVSYPKRIKLFTRSHFEIVTSIDFLVEKIPYLRNIIQNCLPGKITLLDANYYTPYSAR